MHTDLSDGSAVLNGTFLIDAHVHCHDMVDPVSFLDHARRNFAAAASLARLTPVACVLCLTRTATERSFQRLRDALAQRDQGALGEVAGEHTLFGQFGDDPPILIVDGRQVVTSQGIEVLAIGTPDALADGLELEATLEAVARAGAVAILPYAFGKWWGARGRIVAQALAGLDRKNVFLGDNGGRPGLIGTPRMFEKAHSQGLIVLRGSDPLPFRDDASRVGSFGFVAQGEIDLQRPSSSLKSLLRALPDEPRSYGKPQPIHRFVGQQLALRRARRNPERVARHDGGGQGPGDRRSFGG